MNVLILQLPCEVTFAKEALVHFCNGCQIVHLDMDHSQNLVK